VKLSRAVGVGKWIQERALGPAKKFESSKWLVFFSRLRLAAGMGSESGAIAMSGMFSTTSLSLMAQGLSGSSIMQFAPLLIIMVIFYVLLILPAQRRQKKTQEMLGALKNGDKVITNGGLYGTIVGLEGDAIQLRISDQVKVKVLRSAVSTLQPEGKEE
jgi:preprotein translocase subunit YajC